MPQAERISALLESQHRRIDERFDRFGKQLRQGEIEAEAFDEVMAALHRHIYLEEEILFPEVEARGLTGPTAQMAQEHGEICGLLSAIEDGIAGGASPARLQNLLVAVVNRLKEHNLKEERVLYPSADQLLSAGDRVRILDRMEKTQLPNGWRCRARGGVPE